MSVNITSNHIFKSKTFKILDRCSWWVQNAYNPWTNDLAKQKLDTLDSVADCFEKDVENKKILEKKANNFCNKKCDLRGESIQACCKQQREKERQIFAFFTELMVVKELSEKSFEKIKFIEESNKKTPDLKAIKDDIEYFIEVKRIQNPRDEDEAFKSQGKCSGSVNTNFHSPLLKKINDFVNDAKEKFEQSNCNLQKIEKILILDFDPGISARLNCEDFNPDLDNIFGNGFFEELECEHSMVIWRRKYF